MFKKTFSFFLNWISKLFFLNVYWLLFTLFGLVLFGVFPATSASFSMVRRWLQEDNAEIQQGNIEIQSESSFKQFLSYYKNDFIKANILGVVIVIISILVYSDLLFIKYFEFNHDYQKILLYCLTIMLIFLIMTMIYIFPINSHYELSVFAILKNSFLLVFLKPFQSIFLIICLLFMVLSMFMIPGLVFVLGISLTICIISYLTLRIFNQIRN